MSGYRFYVTPEEYAIALSNNINANAVNLRVRSNAWHIERAITTPPQEHNKWAKWLKVAEKNGISSVAFYGRVNRGMEPSKAATTPIRDNQKTMKLMAEQRRKYPKKYEDIAKANGISQSTFGARMRRGWNPELAATTPVDAKFRAKEMAKV